MMPTRAAVRPGPTVTVTLGWPPSVNRYWRHPTRGKLAGRHLISAEGRQYRERAALMIRIAMLQAGLPSPVKAPVRCVIFANPPDARRRDLDNVLKVLLDALQAGGAIRDDGDITSLVIEKDYSRTPRGAVLVEVMGMA